MGANDANNSRFFWVQENSRLSVQFPELIIGLSSYLDMNEKGTPTSQKSAASSHRSSHTKRKSSDADKGNGSSRERGERGGKKRTRTSNEVRVVGTSVAAAASVAATRREPDRRIYQCEKAHVCHLHAHTDVCELVIGDVGAVHCVGCG